MKDKKLQLYKNISCAYTFKKMAEKEGVKPLVKDLSPIKNAALLLNSKGQIEWIGKEKDLNIKKYNISKIYDLEGKNIYPSFTESHTHLVYGGKRTQEFEDKINGATYLEIQKKGGGIKKTVKDTQKASYDELLNQAQKRVNNFKAQGVTLVEVKSGYGQNFKTEKKQLEVINSLKGIKVTPTYLGLHSFHGDKSSYVKRVIEKDLPKMKELFPKLKRADLFVEKGFFDLKDLKSYVRSLNELGMSFCAHVDQLSSVSGAVTSAELGALSVEHAVHLKKSEIQKLSKFSTVLNLLPTADFYLDVDYPNARELIDSGVRVGLSTDMNPGTSPTQSLNFVGLLARRVMKMTLPEVFCAYTLNASRALGVFDKGALIKGWQGDFISTNASPEDFFYDPYPALEIKTFNKTRAV